MILLCLLVSSICCLLFIRKPKPKPIKISISVCSVFLRSEVEQAEPIGRPWQSQPHLQYISSRMEIHTIQTIVKAGSEILVGDTSAKKLCYIIRCMEVWFYCKGQRNH